MNITQTLLKKEMQGYVEVMSSFFEDEELFSTLSLDVILDEIRASDKDFRDLTLLFARTRVTSIRQEMRRHSDDFYSSKQFHSFLVKYLFYKLLHAYAMEFHEHEDLPLDHHWLSRCYIKRFSLPTDKNIEFSVLEASGKYEVLSEDFFVHNRTQEGAGYFPLYMERFFGLVEADYATSMVSGQFSTIQDHQGDNLTRLVMACYYVISQVRIPKREVRRTQVLREAWSHRETEEYTKGIFNIVEGMRDLLNIATVSVPFDLILAPMVPVYTRQSGTGIKMRLFPIAKDKMAIFSERLDSEEIHRGLEGYNRTVSLRAKRLGTFVIV